MRNKPRAIQTAEYEENRIFRVGRESLSLPILRREERPSRDGDPALRDLLQTQLQQFHIRSNYEFVVLTLPLELPNDPRDIGVPQARSPGRRR